MPFRQSLAAFALVCSGATLAAADDSAAQSFQLHLRTSRETKQGSGQFVARIDDAHWDARKTAVVICDMWDQHWCRGASERVAEMAPRMNKVVAAARARGALIVHCPSDTMDAYKDTPQRKLAAAAPVAGGGCRCCSSRSRSCGRCTTAAPGPSPARRSRASAG